MANKVDKFNESEARLILQDWKINSGEKLQDIAQKLSLAHSTVSPWFAQKSKQASPMPVNRAIELKNHYASFPAQEYLKALIDFYDEFEPEDDKLSGIYAFFEAYGEMVGYGYWASGLKEYFSIINDVENQFVRRYQRH